MKALILAAGRGKRLGVISQGLNKCMLEVKGRPLIEYSLESAASLQQIDQIVLVVGYKAEDIKQRFGNVYQGKKIVYVSQAEQKGLVHAIECAKDALEEEDFMLMLGDEFMVNARHDDFIRAFSLEKVFALCGVVSVKDRSLISKTYAVVQIQDGRISRLIEKPLNPPNQIMGTGNCVFSNRILDYIRTTPINQNRQERELPDLIQCAIDDGKIVKTFEICKEYINVNSQAELVQSNSYFAHL